MNIYIYPGIDMALDRPNFIEFTVTQRCILDILCI